MRDVIAAPNKKGIAGPVAKKSALTSFMHTLEARKPPDGANIVIGTFSETRVSKCTLSRIQPANLPATPRPPSVLNVVVVLPVVNRTWD